MSDGLLDNLLIHMKACKETSKNITVWEISTLFMLLCCDPLRPDQWLGTYPSGRRSLTCAHMWSHQATVWTPATMSSSQRRCAKVTWWRWEARLNHGRNAGSCSIASNGPSPIMLVRHTDLVLYVSLCCQIEFLLSNSFNRLGSFVFCSR